MRVVGSVLLIMPVIAVPQTWVQLTDLPGSARDDAAIFGDGAFSGSIMVGTGMEVGFALTNDWYSFSPGAMTWSSMPALPAQPRQYAATFSDAGRLFGGSSASGPLNDLWWFDENPGVWTQLASMPSFSRYAATGIYGYGAKCYVAGGLDSAGNATNEFWEYAIGSDAWTQLPSIPGPGRHRSHGFQGADLVIVAGGADSAFTPLDDVRGYDPLNQQWVQLPSLPYGIYGGAFAGTGPDDMYILGGVTTNNSYQDTVWRFMEDSAAWMPFAVLPDGAGRKGGVAGISTGWSAGIYFGTGIDSAFVRHRDWYKLSLDHVPGEVHEETRGSVELHPNPVLSVLRITGQLNDQLEVRVFDGTGRCVRALGISGAIDLDVSGWNAGVYLLRSMSRSGEVQHHRFIKV